MKINEYLGHDICHAPPRVKKATGAKGEGFNDIGGVSLVKDGKVVKSFWYANFDFAGFDRALDRAMAFCRAAAGIPSEPASVQCWALIRLS